MPTNAQKTYFKVMKFAFFISLLIVVGCHKSPKQPAPRTPEGNLLILRQVVPHKSLDGKEKICEYLFQIIYEDTTGLYTRPVAYHVTSDCQFYRIGDEIYRREL